MVRYFKQIAKSVRANGSASSGSEENADDFLGCINIPLNVSVSKSQRLLWACVRLTVCFGAGDAGRRLRHLV